MSYRYADRRPELFTDQGQRDFIQIRDEVKRLLRLAGAMKMSAILGTPMHTAGDTWFTLACVDRMVELEEIREITPPSVAGQDRVFVAARDFP